MNNDDLLKYIKLWLPELNSVQVDRLRKEFKRVEVEARIHELKLCINEYNFMQEEVEQPTKELKIGNHYVLDRIAMLKAEL